jgi:CRISPR-associated endonuclease/helicase Cas3
VGTLLHFWAKLGSATWPDEYHPVICHLIDVAAVTRHLWDQVFRHRFRTWLASRLGLAEDHCARWLAFWCGAHDIGKVAPCFQDRGKNTVALRTRLEPPFNFPPGNKPHGDLSTKILADELAGATNWPAICRVVAHRVAVAVGGHHGIFPTNWDEIRSPLGNDCWATVRRELLTELARLCGVTNLPAPQPTRPEDQSVWMCLAGLTSVADWIGSNQTFFRPRGESALVDGPFDVDDYFKEANRRATEALDKLGWLGRADTNEVVTFGELFRFQPRPLQTAVAEMVAGVTEPGLLIVEAPMGEGKTEAGWYAVAHWDRCGGQGAYVALPTMATSNQMFDRVGGFLEADAGKKNLMLQHGKAALNARFQELKYAALLYDETQQPSAVVAEGWFAANKKHGLLAPYGVGTIDQALLAVLQTKHVFVRLFGLAGKCVILDEVHAYDRYMTTLMAQLLRWLSALGCPVVLLSATLPRARRLELLRGYAGDDSPEPEDVPYPRLTSAAVGGRPKSVSVQADPERAKTVALGWLEGGRLAEYLRTALADGGCAVVIRNTVGLAQDTYVALRDALQRDGIEVTLFHARFPFGQRMEIEDAVLKCFGKEGGRAERDKRVLVATQVVEQSLDLDFDLMVSDVAPVDLVLQRAGRLHRHERGPRPVGVAEPKLWLLQPPTKDRLPDFRPSERVYAPFVLLRSYLALDAVLQAVGAVRLPDDLERLVEQVYGEKPLTVPDGWRMALAESETKLREKQERQQLDATNVAIAPPDGSPLEQPSQQLEEDDPEAAKQIQAQTRDSDPTVQLIVIYHLGDQDYLDPTGREPFKESDEPNLERIRTLLNNEVTLSHRRCFAFFAAQSVPRAWREKGLLRYHRILRVDRDGNFHGPEGFSLRVDPKLGVKFTDD